jgi:hypothetical protein
LYKISYEYQIEKNILQKQKPREEKVRKWKRPEQREDLFSLWAFSLPFFFSVAPTNKKETKRKSRTSKKEMQLS